MAEITGNCPRCGAKHVTFDVPASTKVEMVTWQSTYEAFSICRHCGLSSILVLKTKTLMAANALANMSPCECKGSLSALLGVTDYISIKDAAAIAPPPYLPAPIEAVFNEGARCLAVKCFNAAGTMFRLCVDLATVALLPQEGNTTVPQPSAKQRRDLGLRIPWLFENKLLDESLHDLSVCIKDDGNDGAHRGTLTEADAEDLLDFATRLLERLYTEPERIRLAKIRQQERRTAKQQ